MVKQSIGINGSNKLLNKLRKDLISLGFTKTYSCAVKCIKSIVIYKCNDFHCYQMDDPLAYELITLTESNYTEVLTKLKQRL